MERAQNRSGADIADKFPTAPVSIVPPSRRFVTGLASTRKREGGTE